MLHIPQKSIALLALALGLAQAPIAQAQTEVVGLYYDGSNRQMFRSTPGDFVGDWDATTGFIPLSFHALDFNASSTELYAISYSIGYYGTLDQDTGAFTSMGISGLPGGQIHGLTSHPDGVTWYAIGVSGTDSQLYRGDMLGGGWTAVGGPMLGLRLWDISCNSAGDLYAESIHTQELHSIDPVTGVPTLVGSLGIAMNYAQGFDFDWTDDTLYATISQGPGGGGAVWFASINTTTGAATMVADAAGLYLQAEMAIKNTTPPVLEPFCDPQENNSTGFPTKLIGDFEAPGGTGLHLEAEYGPAGQFGFFLVGTGITEPGVMISEGRLCLSSAVGDLIGRYTIPGGAMNSVGQFDGSGILVNLVGTSTVGTGFDVPLELPFLGTPTISVGETWHFQLWHRDVGDASNFSNGLSVTF